MEEQRVHYPSWMQQEAGRREAQPGRPLDVLMTGGAVAMGALAAVLAIVYRTWYLHEMDEDLAILVSGFLFFVYTAGIYVFCYGWERGDVAKAVRMTVIVVLLSAVAVLVAGLALAILSRTKGGGGSASSAGGGGSGVMNLAVPMRVIGSYLEDGTLRLDDDGGDREGPAQSEPHPSELQTLTCERCSQIFIPLPPKATCPDCGWAAVTVA